jgi:DNA-binding IclR family transcriptional regulator
MDDITAGRTSRSQSGIQVISRAASILRALRDEREGLSLAQIAERVRLPRSTVQRIVHALVTERLLMAASPNGRVRLGTEISALANNSKIDVVEVAHPLLAKLAEQVGETVDLAVLRGDHLLFLDQIAGTHRLRAVSAVGEQFPLHSTANGKASLALMSDAEIRQQLAGVRLANAKGKTRTIDSLLQEINEIRTRGIAFDREEHSLGICALGTAFRDQAGTIYAISIPIPTNRAPIVEPRALQLLLSVRDRLRTLFGT